MRNILVSACAASAALAVVASGSAEARCYSFGHHLACGYHRSHYSHRVAYRSLAAGYGYAYPSYGYGSGLYGSGYPGYGSGSFSVAAEMGPSPRGGGGP